MKILKNIFVICIALVIFAIPIHAQNRVIYQFEQQTDNSGKILLKWIKESSENNNIRITGFKQINNNTLQVNYKTGLDILNYPQITIYMPNIKLPIQIILKEENSKEILLKDLKDTDEDYYPILNLYNRGIINGYDDNTYKGYKCVTREEFVKMLVDTAGYKLKQNISSKFNDVENNRWSKKYIMTLTEKGIINGRSKNYFAPSELITIGEVASVIDKTFDFYKKDKKKKINRQKTYWSDIYIHSLLESNIIKENDQFYANYNPNKPATREECALILNRALLVAKDRK